LQTGDICTFFAPFLAQLEVVRYRNYYTPGTSVLQDKYGLSQMNITGTYDPYLVALSFAVACLASYTALDLGGRIRVSRRWARLTWLATAAIAMGGGIWSMHFIAMLAFFMPMPVSYDFGLTLFSLVVAIAVTAVGFFMIGARQATAPQLVLSGIFMGIGIVAMHYTGMAAMRMPAELRYDRALVALSVLIAIGASIAALWLAFRTTVTWQRLLAAVVMGSAISGMHYTGMAAARFIAHPGMDEARGVPSLAQSNLALAIAAITFVILLLALVASTFDRKLTTLAEREAALLRESEAQLRKLYRETPLPLHAVGADGRIEQVSDAWLKLLGYPREDTTGRNLTDFMTEDSKRRYERAVWPRLQLGDDVKEVECRFVRKSGEVLDVLLNAHGERANGKPVRMLGGIVDITARKRAEEALRQSQRMEAMGQLTGGVAHDFNNLLMVITGAADKLGRTIQDEKVARSLEMIATAVKRGKDLTSHLLSFARRQTFETAVLDLTEMLPKFEEMLKRSLRGDIEIRTRVDGGPCRVHVDPGELELALLNLGVNARDAMPDGGILSLAIRRVELFGGADTDALRGTFVALELADTGVGIPAAALSHVFDPFFTTKGPEKGTGLGLSQVYGFAKQSGGTATIHSEPGHGTTISIYLPATDAPVRVEQKAEAVDREPRTGKGTVLLVEDSKEVAAILAEYLEQLGFAVDHVWNASDALRNLQSRGPYRLVVTDILMPGSVAGLELARIVRGNYSQIPILLTTGYSERAQEAVLEGFSVLQKPYDLQTLSDAIRTLQSA
jgi:PAS domain S-box-containing protein